MLFSYSLLAQPGVTTLPATGDPNCYDNSKGENVSFNIGLEFFKFKLTAKSPKTAFLLKKDQFKGSDDLGFIERMPGGRVKLTYGRHAQTGKLIGVIRGPNSPTYVKWDNKSLNLRGTDLKRELDLLAGLDLCGPIKHTFKNLTVIINYDAAWRMEVWGIKLEEKSNGIFWMYKGQSISLSSEKYKDAFIFIAVKNYSTGTYLTFFVTTKDGKKITFIFNDHLNLFVKINLNN